MENANPQTHHIEPPWRPYDEMTPDEIADAQILSPRQREVAVELDAASDLSRAACDEFNEHAARHADLVDDRAPAVAILREEVLCFRASAKSAQAMALHNRIKEKWGDIRMGERHPELMRRGLHPALRHTRTKYDVPRLPAHELRDLRDAVAHLRRLVAKPPTHPDFDAMRRT
jgi:hypothetical protein